MGGEGLREMARDGLSLATRRGAQPARETAAATGGVRDPRGPVQRARALGGGALGRSCWGHAVRCGQRG